MRRLVCEFGGIVGSWRSLNRQRSDLEGGILCGISIGALTICFCLVVIVVEEDIMIIVGDLALANCIC